MRPRMHDADNVVAEIPGTTDADEISQGRACDAWDFGAGHRFGQRAPTARSSSTWRGVITRLGPKPARIAPARGSGTA